MDAIRKKMQSLKSETSGLCAIIDGFEKATKESAAKAEQVQKQVKEVEGDVLALTRRIMLMEEEDKKAVETLCHTVTRWQSLQKLLTMS